MVDRPAKKGTVMMVASSSYNDALRPPGMSISVSSEHVCHFQCLVLQEFEFLGLFATSAAGWSLSADSSALLHSPAASSICKVPNDHNTTTRMDSGLILSGNMMNRCDPSSAT